MPASGKVKPVLVDSGHVTAAGITELEKGKDGQPSGLTVLAAVQREPHGRTVAQLEVRPDPSPPAEDAAFLQRLAHRTATAAGRVLYKQRQHSDRLRLVLLDLVMPQMDGVEAFSAMHRHAPDVPVVIMSGFAGNLNFDRFAEAKPAALLAKPFTRETLQARLEATLGRN